jgi:hypothetical protein
MNSVRPPKAPNVNRPLLFAHDRESTGQQSIMVQHFGGLKPRDIRPQRPAIH